MASISTQASGSGSQQRSSTAPARITLQDPTITIVPINDFLHPGSYQCASQFFAQNSCHPPPGMQVFTFSGFHVARVFQVLAPNSLKEA